MIYDFLDDVLRMDVRACVRQGVLKSTNPQKMVLTSKSDEKTGAVTVYVRDEMLFVRARIREGNEQKMFAQTIFYTHTDVHLGGKRAWWLCPKCARRCALLYYGDEDKFVCSKCLGMPYRIQNLGLQETLIARLDRQREKLGPNLDRPKWMRKKTYDRHYRNIHLARDAMLEAAISAYKKTTLPHVKAWRESEYDGCEGFTANT